MTTFGISKVTPFRGNNVALFENSQPFTSLCNPSEIMKVVIESPALNLKFELLFIQEVSIQQIILLCMDFYHNFGGKEVFFSDLAISARRNKIPVLFGVEDKIQANQFDVNQILWLHKKKLDLKVDVEIEEENTTTSNSASERTKVKKYIELQFDSYGSVTDVVNELCKILEEDLSPLRNLSLGLYLKTKIGLFKLEENRKLLFYRIEEHPLIFTRNKNLRASGIMRNFTAGTSDIIAIIKCPTIGIEKTVRLQGNSTVSTAISRFVEKHPLEHLDCYSIISDQTGEILNPLLKISDYNLRYPCNLSLQMDRQKLKMKQKPKSGQKNKAEKKNSHPTIPKDEKFVFAENFGIHHGYSEDEENRIIPKILVDFKRFLSENNAFSQQGIFRVAGSEIRIQSIYMNISSSSYVYSGDNETNAWGIPEIASLIKRWFLSMPNKLFDDISERQLRSFSEVNPTEIQSVLPPSKQHLFNWLVDLLSEAANRSALSKMDPFNLGLVIAPCIVCGYDASPMTQLALTRYAATIIEKNIITRLRSGSTSPRWQNPVLKGGVLLSSSPTSPINVGKGEGLSRTGGMLKSSNSDGVGNEAKNQQRFLARSVNTFDVKNDNTLKKNQLQSSGSNLNLYTSNTNTHYWKPSTIIIEDQNDDNDNNDNNNHHHHLQVDEINNSNNNGSNNNNGWKEFRSANYFSSDESVNNNSSSNGSYDRSSGYSVYDDLTDDNILDTPSHSDSTSKISNHVNNNNNNYNNNFGGGNDDKSSQINNDNSNINANNDITPTLQSLNHNSSIKNDDKKSERENGDNEDSNIHLKPKVMIGDKFTNEKQRSGTLESISIQATLMKWKHFEVEQLSKNRYTTGVPKSSLKSNQQINNGDRSQHARVEGNSNINSHQGINSNNHTNDDKDNMKKKKKVTPFFHPPPTDLPPLPPPNIMS